VAPQHEKLIPRVQMARYIGREEEMSGDE